MLPPGHPLDFFVKQPKTKKTQKHLIIIKTILHLYDYFQQHLYEKFNLLKEISYHFHRTQLNNFII